MARLFVLLLSLGVADFTGKHNGGHGLLAHCVLCRVQEPQGALANVSHKGSKIVTAATSRVSLCKRKPLLNR